MHDRLGPESGLFSEAARPSVPAPLETLVRRSLMGSGVAPREWTSRQFCF